MQPIYYIDFYKVGHVSQFPPGISRIWTNWTPRSSRTNENGMIHFGLQRFLIDMEDQFHAWMKEPWAAVERHYKEVMAATLGMKDAKTDHLQQLHRYGRLPLDIYSVPEGTFVPVGVPALVVVNTQPWAFWLPNYIETMLSAYLWKPTTSSTTAMIYQRIFTDYARTFGHDDMSFVRWQAHDFSFRGMGGVEDAIGSGLGHLTSFGGTDTLPAILGAQKYYGADLDCGGSVPATEHSVMCAGGMESELDTFRRLLTEVYPSGIVSIVSDTWDLWKVLTEYVPKLKDVILAREGKMVIRPDSGDPVKILCGDPDSSYGPERAGAIRLLADCLGVDKQGLINKGGLIYGDSITPERAKAILHRNHTEIGLSPFNLVFGVGSYTYTYCTRDTYGLAMKATAVEQDGVVKAIFKDPVTDDGVKRSHKGIPTANWGEDGVISNVCRQGTDPNVLDNCAFVKIFSDGYLSSFTSLYDIRKRVMLHANRTSGK